MPETANFQNLIERVRSRDQDAARELVQNYEGAIRRVIRIQMRDARLRQVLDSTDVCQSVLATFFVRTALGQYELDSPAQLISLLTTIARNKLIHQVDRMRAQRRDVSRNLSADVEGLDLVDRASDPSEQASAREILQQVLLRLGPDERYLAERRSIGRAWTELANELGKTDVALRKQLSRSLDRVMTELGVDESSAP